MCWCHNHSYWYWKLAVGPYKEINRDANLKRHIITKLKSTCKDLGWSLVAPRLSHGQSGRSPVGRHMGPERPLPLPAGDVLRGPGELWTEHDLLPAAVRHSLHPAAAGIFLPPPGDGQSEFLIPDIMHHWPWHCPSLSVYTRAVKLKHTVFSQSAKSQWKQQSHLVLLFLLSLSSAVTPTCRLANTFLPA